MRKVLACGKVCHRLLEACPHLCEAACHAGPCPTECSALVTVSTATAAQTASVRRLSPQRRCLGQPCRAPVECIALQTQPLL